jgi:hypothetical protein
LLLLGVVGAVFFGRSDDRGEIVGGFAARRGSEEK